MLLKWDYFAYNGRTHYKFLFKTSKCASFLNINILLILLDMLYSVSEFLCLNVCYFKYNFYSWPTWISWCKLLFSFGNLSRNIYCLSSFTIYDCTYGGLPPVSRIWLLVVRSQAFPPSPYAVLGPSIFLAFPSSFDRSEDNKISC